MTENQNQNSPEIQENKSNKTVSTNDNSVKSEEGPKIIKKTITSSSNNYDYLFKISLIGDSDCGKTSILIRYSNGTFNDNTQSTIGVDFKIASLQIDNTIIKLQLWDTCGSERFKSITASFLKSCSAFILVFDITSAKSFNNLTNWIKMINESTKANFYCLVGNKADLEEKRQVPTHEAIRFAEKNGLYYLETSAKTDLRIDEVFNHVSKILYSEISRKKSLVLTEGDDKLGQLGHSKEINIKLTENIYAEKNETDKQKGGCSC